MTLLLFHMSVVAVCEIYFHASRPPSIYCFWILDKSLDCHGFHENVVFAKVFGLSLWCPCLGLSLWICFAALLLLYGTLLEITVLNSIADESLTGETRVRCIFNLQFYNKRIQLYYNHIHHALFMSLKYTGIHIQSTDKYCNVDTCVSTGKWKGSQA